VSKHWHLEIPPCEQVKALRERDGGRCWLCDRPINFKAEPNSDKTPSREHLIPESRGGPNTFDNLVLCHPPCNRELKDLLPLVEKVRMREERREAAWRAALRQKIIKTLLA
jgi:5-methylcytosine-specific restriction endonuclease McrA